MRSSIIIDGENGPIELLEPFGLAGVLLVCAAIECVCLEVPRLFESRFVCGCPFGIGGADGDWTAS